MVVAVFCGAPLGAVELVVHVVDAFDEFVNRCIAGCFAGYLSVCWGGIVNFGKDLGNAGAWHEFEGLVGLVL